MGEGVVSSHTHTIRSKSSSSLLYWRSVIDIETFSDSHRWRGYVAQPFSRPVSSGYIIPWTISRDHIIRIVVCQVAHYTVCNEYRNRGSLGCGCRRQYLATAAAAATFVVKLIHQSSQHSKSRPTSNPTNSSATWTWVTY